MIWEGGYILGKVMEVGNSPPGEGRGGIGNQIKPCYDVLLPIFPF